MKHGIGQNTVYHSDHMHTIHCRGQELTGEYSRAYSSEYCIVSPIVHAVVSANIRLMRCEHTQRISQCVGSTRTCTCTYNYYRAYYTYLYIVHTHMHTRTINMYTLYIHVHVHVHAHAYHRHTSFTRQQLWIFGVDQISEVTPIIKYQIEWLSIGPEDGLVNAPLVLLISLSLPGIHRNATLSHGRRCVVLCGENVTRTPLHLFGRESRRWRKGDRKMWMDEVKVGKVILSIPYHILQIINLYYCDDRSRP